MPLASGGVSHQKVTVGGPVAFAATTSQLHRLRLWLADNDVTVVGMEPTGP